VKIGDVGCTMEGRVLEYQRIRTPEHQNTRTSEHRRIKHITVVEDATTK